MIRRYQAVLLVVVLLLSGCAGKGIIPARKMASILHDMYVVDAQLSTETSYSTMADTTSVYGAVFADHGYSQEDFSRSLDYYLHNPVKFREIFSMVQKRFDSEVGNVDINPDELLLEEIFEPEGSSRRVPGRRLRRTSEPDDNE